MSFSKYLNDQQLAAIGRVAVESAWLETAIERYISRLSRLSRKNTEALLDGRMMSFKIETLKMFGKAATKDPNKRNEFFDLMTDIAAANRDRNTVIHGLWGAGMPKTEIDGLSDFLFPYEVEAKKRTSPGNFKTMKASEIDRVADAVAASTWRLMSFGSENWLQYLTPSERRREMLVQELLRRLSESPTP
jgi:hypothetical protein